MKAEVKQILESMGMREITHCIWETKAGAVYVRENATPHDLPQIFMAAGVDKHNATIKKLLGIDD